METNRLIKEKPIGVSGLMRVKNEDEYLEASINSVIDALDELIISYHDCSDRTLEILERKQKDYPHKILLFHYKPRIYAHDLTLEEFEYAYYLPDDSPHLLNTYYNETLSKATYLYAVKIDADQIYFKKYFAQICAAYRSDKHFRFTFIEKFVGSLFEDLRTEQLGKTKLFLGNILIWSKLFGYFYQHYVLKKISNEKGCTWISGINLSLKNEEYVIPISYTENGETRFLRIYNGEMDHCFFEITEETYFFPGRHYYSLDQSKLCGYSFIEAFHTGQITSSVFAGFLWYHMRWCKKLNMKGKIFHSIPYSFLKKYSAEELDAQNLFRVSQCYPLIFYFYHTCILDYQLKKYGSFSLLNKLQL